VELYRREKLLIRTQEPSGNSTNSHIAANQEELGEGNYAFEVYLLILRSDIYML
jgi:hypothetical protein